MKSFHPRDRETMMRTVIEASPEPIFVKSRDNRYVLTNTAFLEVCGLSEATGKKDTELFPPAFVSIVRQHDDQVMAEGKTIQAEERLEIEGTLRTFSVTKFPLMTGSGEVMGMGGIAIETTQRQKAEEHNARLRLEQTRSEAASEAKTRLLSTVSHELRAPLSGIVGMGEILAESLPAGEPRELAAHIERAGRDLLRIINDLLDLSRAESGKLEVTLAPTSVADLLGAVDNTLQVAARARGVAIERVLTSGVPAWVLADAGRLRQVLINLVGNAIKFSQDTPVRVEVAPSGVGDGRLHFSVTDEGIGIPAGEQERIFLPFEQTRAGKRVAPEGTGLGLPICRNLVGVMGGELHLDSAVGRGSRFWFELPLSACAPPAGAHNGAAAVVSAARALTGRVLVVDDCVTTQQLSCKLLTRLGLRCEVAADGAAAIAQMSSSSFDAVLMDFHLPDQTGPEVAQALLALPGGRGTPIIGLSASAGADEDRACQAAGMVDYLVKPVSLDALRHVLATRMLARAGRVGRGEARAAGQA